MYVLGVRQTIAYTKRNKHEMIYNYYGVIMMSKLHVSEYLPMRVNGEIIILLLPMQKLFWISVLILCNIL